MQKSCNPKGPILEDTDNFEIFAIGIFQQGLMRSGITDSSLSHAMSAI